MVRSSFSPKQSGLEEHAWLLVDALLEISEMARVEPVTDRVGLFKWVRTLSRAGGRRLTDLRDGRGIES
jgi:hypothetical protein